MFTVAHVAIALGAHCSMCLRRSARICAEGWIGTTVNMPLFPQKEHLYVSLAESSALQHVHSKNRYSLVIKVSDEGWVDLSNLSITRFFIFFILKLFFSSKAILRRSASANEVCSSSIARRSR